MSVQETLSILSWGLLVLGGVFGLVGALGLHRFPDFYTRTHASGLVDSFSAPMILIGLLLQAHHPLVAIKLVLILLFLFFTSPTAGHALVRAAFFHGLRPILKDQAYDDQLRTGALPPDLESGKEAAPSKS